MAKVIPIRPARQIIVRYDDDGWHVKMGNIHKVFAKRHNAAGFIDVLQRQHIAYVTVEGEIPDG